MSSIANQVISVRLDGVDYVFKNVTIVDRNDPLVKSLLCSPQAKTDGLVVTSGLTSAVVFNYTLYEVPLSVRKQLYTAFENDTRLNFKRFDTSTGESTRIENAIIATNPYNSTIEESETSASLILQVQVARNNVKDEEV